MKIFKILAVLCIFLFSMSFVNAQQDSTTYKVKLEKFKTKKMSGMITTIVAGTAIVAGGICALVGGQTEKNWWGDEKWPRNSTLFYGGCGLAGVGIIAIIPGSINWSVGKKKVKEYQIRLDDARSGFYFNPKSVGVTLAFKF